MAKGKDSDCKTAMSIGPGLNDELWHRGYCAEYALALIKKNPHLHLGFSAEEDLHTEWDPYSGDPAPYTAISHVFAHDSDFAYDSLGKHPLPYFHSWEAGYQPISEHNYFGYNEQELIDALAENWSDGSKNWQPDQTMLDLASSLLRGD